MYVKNSSFQLILILLIPNLTFSGPVSNPEISTKPGKQNNNISIQQQQPPKLSNIQDAQLNTLSVYASNYDVMLNKQNQNENFKPSYKLPEMETNFTPIHNSNIITPPSLGPQPPILMQYLPQTINENGIQYLQLIPTRPIMVPIAPYITGNAGVQSLTYQQHLTPSNSIDYATQPLLSALPANVPPPPPSPLIGVPALPLPSYGIQSYADNASPFKLNHRINRETKDKQLLGPLTLNLNEYIPSLSSQQHTTFNIQGRP